MIDSSLRFLLIVVPLCLTWLLLVIVIAWLQQKGWNALAVHTGLRLRRKPWSELAARTGLEYRSLKIGMFGRETPAFLAGLYHSHLLTLYTVTSTLGRNVTRYTRISVAVDNATNGYMLIRNARAANVQLRKLFFRTRGIPTGDEEFDRQFFIEKSQPEDFAAKVLASYSLRHNLQRALRNTRRRHIELSGQALQLQEVAPWFGGERNVDYLQSLFDVMIELAQAIDTVTGNGRTVV